MSWRRRRPPSTDDKWPHGHSLMALDGPMNLAHSGPLSMPPRSALHGPPDRILITDSIYGRAELRLGVYRVEATPVGWVAYWTPLSRIDDDLPLP